MPIDPAAEITRLLRDSARGDDAARAMPKVLVDSARRRFAARGAVLPGPWTIRVD